MEPALGAVGRARSPATRCKRVAPWGAAVGAIASARVLRAGETVASNWRAIGAPLDCRGPRAGRREVCKGVRPVGGNALPAAGAVLGPCLPAALRLAQARGRASPLVGRAGPPLAPLRVLERAEAEQHGAVHATVETLVLHHALQVRGRRLAVRRSVQVLGQRRAPQPEGVAPGRDQGVAGGALLWRDFRRGRRGGVVRRGGCPASGTLTPRARERRLRPCQARCQQQQPRRLARHRPLPCHGVPAVLAGG